MTTGKLLWLGWCVLWALGWATLGWLVFPINLLMFLLSLALIPSFVGGR